MNYRKSHSHLYFDYLLVIAIGWLFLDYFQINIRAEFLINLLSVVFESQLALVALAFVVQIPRLKEYERVVETQKEIKEDWKRFLQRFVAFIAFILIAFLILEFFQSNRLINLILVITSAGLFYLFKSVFSYIKNI